MKNEYYTFNDVFLIPQLTDCTSRSALDTSTTIGNVSLGVPIISANMDTVTGPKMASEIRAVGGWRAPQIQYCFRSC